MPAPPRPHTFARTGTLPPAAGGLARSQTYTLVPRSTTTYTTSAPSFDYHSATAPIPAAFAPAPATAAPVVCESAPDRSKRFIATRLRLSRWDVVAGSTFLTFASVWSTLGTACNVGTLGLTAGLWRIYYVEVQLQGVELRGEEEVRAFVEHGMRQGVGGAAETSGERIAKWLEYLQLNERRSFGFYKLQGTSFSVYLVVLPRMEGNEVDIEPLKERVTKSYKVIDGLDNVVMLAGRFGNSVWQLFEDSGPAKPKDPKSKGSPKPASIPYYS